MHHGSLSTRAPYLGCVEVGALDRLPELVHDDGYSESVILSQNVMDERGLARAQEP